MRKATRQRKATEWKDLTATQRADAKRRRLYVISDRLPAGRYLAAKARIGK